MERYLPTGNEMISLPKLNEQTAAIEDLTFLSMQQRGMIELCGTENVPLMQPFIQIDQEELALTGLQWSREHFWIPSGHKETEQATVKFTVLTPVGERGFAMRLSVTARTDCRLKLGARGLWSKSVHCVNEDKELTGQAYIYESAWNSSFIMDYRVGFPAFALAPMSDHAGKSEWAQTEDGISYQISCALDAKAGQEEAFTIFWGLGFEEVAAATSAKEQLRRGWDWLYRKTADWLDKRTVQLPTPELTEVYNVNQFFCLFYATGRTFDTEELVCATSRSTRYYVSAAYWDRDSLLWAFPTILRADAALAKEVLTYVFSVPSVVCCGRYMAPISVSLSPALSVSLSLTAFCCTLSCSFFLPPFELTVITIVTIRAIRKRHIAAKISLAIITSFLWLAFILFSFCIICVLAHYSIII